MNIPQPPEVKGYSYCIQESSNTLGRRAGERAPLGQLGHSKAPMYAEKFRKLCTFQGWTRAEKRPGLNFCLLLILVQATTEDEDRVENGLAKCKGVPQHSSSLEEVFLFPPFLSPPLLFSSSSFFAPSLSLFLSPSSPHISFLAPHIQGNPVKTPEHKLKA